MSISNNVNTQTGSMIPTNDLYESMQDDWHYFYKSYLGGTDYREGHYLVKYQNESDAEYSARLRATPLENHCASVIGVYNSFLFREDIERELGTLKTMPEVEDLLEDADLDGRSLDNFMSDINVWSSVFGHAWIVVVQPNVDATTRAQQQLLGVRPYLNMLTPLSVLDWEYSRNIVGRYELAYFKYIEDVNGDVVTVKEWYPQVIVTTIYDMKKKVSGQPITETNGLGVVPIVCAYNQRSGHRGVGISDLADIADLQKFIYNATSEVDQSIRLNTHPSLVKSSNTSAGIGAGSLINMDEDMDPALKPYLLEYSGASVESIYTAIEHAVEAIDKIANTGAVRATESRTISGVAMETEFTLLNSKLSSKAKSIELAEEQVWKLVAHYLDRTWTGSINYPDSFNIRDTSSEINQLKVARESATDHAVITAIDNRILEWMGITDVTIASSTPPSNNVE